MRKLLLATACLAALVSPALGSTAWICAPYGSAMRLVYNNGHFGVYYEIVRPGLVQTIPPGSPRFEGTRRQPDRRQCFRLHEASSVE